MYISLCPNIFKTRMILASKLEKFYLYFSIGKINNLKHFDDSYPEWWGLQTSVFLYHHWETLLSLCLQFSSFKNELLYVCSKMHAKSWTFLNEKIKIIRYIISTPFLSKWLMLSLKEIHLMHLFLETLVPRYGRSILTCILAF